MSVDVSAFIWVVSWSQVSTAQTANTGVRNFIGLVRLHPPSPQRRGEWITQLVDLQGHLLTRMGDPDKAWVLLHLRAL